MLKDAHSLNIIILARDQKTKAGKYKMKEESRDAITKFITFNTNTDWMESKDYTKLGRILATAVFIGSELNGEPLRGEEFGQQGVRLYDNIIFLKVNHQFHLRERITQLPSEADKERRELRSKLVSRIEALAPLVEAFESMKDRLTKNGKFPKEEAERRRREQIKGALDKKLAATLTTIKNEWIKIIYKHELEWRMETGAKIAEKYLPIWNTTGVPKEDEHYCATMVAHRIVDYTGQAPERVYTVQSQADMEKTAQRLAEQEGESFFYKMADKLGGLVTGKHQFIDATYSNDGNTPFSSFIHFKFENNTSFSVENKIITNRSPLNNYFYQYPCTFYNVIIDGEKLKGASEFTVKKAFAK